MYESKENKNETKNDIKLFFNLLPIAALALPAWHYKTKINKQQNHLQS